VRASDFQARSADVSIRLDAFLQRHLHWRSRTSIQRLIRDGFVRVQLPAPEREGAPGDEAVERRCGRLLRDGARVVVVIPEELRIVPVPSEATELVVLYEDDEALCVDKPPLLPVHPSGRHLSDSLIQRVHARYRTPDGSGRAPIRLCHRLDRETSGVVLCGKGEQAHRRLMLQFEAREIEKEYLAIVRGSPIRDAGVIEHAIGPSRVSSVRLKMTVAPDGLPCETSWSVVERHGDYTLVSCRPRTGRQHQIRVHMDAIGHPLVGDKLYGLGEEYFLRNAAGELTSADLRALGMPRHALHNHAIAWRAATGDEWRRVESPLPRDMRDFLDRVPR
jgi:23S rRNA pseudouridine1911/1915/1917 synthase